MHFFCILQRLFCNIGGRTRSAHFFDATGIEVPEITLDRGATLLAEDIDVFGNLLAVLGLILAKLEVDDDSFVGTLSAIASSHDAVGTFGDGLAVLFEHDVAFVVKVPRAVEPGTRRRVVDAFCDETADAFGREGRGQEA